MGSSPIALTKTFIPSATWDVEGTILGGPAQGIVANSDHHHRLADHSMREVFCHLELVIQSSIATRQRKFLGVPLVGLLQQLTTSFQK
jgi:vancomycin permeability regulator SanA